MHSPAPDKEGVVVMRKRKRYYAVDPCLGFYAAPITASTPHPPVLSIKQANDDGETSNMVETPGWTILLEACDELSDSTPNVTSPQPSLSSEPDAITVEAFLQRNARRVRLQRYGRRYKTRRIIRSSSCSPPPSLDDDSIDQLEEEDQFRSLKVSRRALSDNPEGRPALHLLPLVSTTDAKLNHAKPIRAIKLWGHAQSRKGIPFRRSSFSYRPEKKTLESKPQYPLNTWNKFESSSSSHKIDRIDTSSKLISKRDPRSIRYSPLVFVPLLDAEKAYDEKIHSSSSSIKCRPRPLGHKSTTPGPSPLVLPSIMMKAPPGQPESCSASYTTSTFISASASVLLSPEMPSSDAYVQTTPEYYPKAHHEIGSEITRLFSPVLDPSTMLLKHNRTPSARKHLRSLGSFPDGFLERVRSVSQNVIRSPTTTLAQCQASTTPTVNDLKVNPIADLQVVSTPAGNTVGLGSSRALLASPFRDRKPVHSLADPTKRLSRVLPCMLSTSRTQDNNGGAPVHIPLLQVNSVQEESSTAAAPFDINAALLFYA